MLVLGFCILIFVYGICVYLGEKPGPSQDDIKWLHKMENGDFDHD